MALRFRHAGGYSAMQIAKGIEQDQCSFGGCRHLIFGADFFLNNSRHAE
ncbi:hypothetical protein [Stenotrophomonas sp. Iso1]|nr:hypothetical protein [Stenotrophomonas sp. Iso1]